MLGKSRNHDRQEPCRDHANAVLEGELIQHSLRPMSIDDYENAYLLWENTEGISLHDTDSRTGMVRFLNRNPGLSSVIVDGDKVIGTILCSHDGRRGYLHHLAVEKAHRRKGLGSELVRRSLANLLEEGITRVNIFILEENDPGIHFWQVNGFNMLEHFGWMQKALG